MSSAQLDTFRVRLDALIAELETCARCGFEIPEGRLDVMPEAGLCVRRAARS
jgi:RNA polymerase-binding transcription factor DksA